MRKAPEQLPAHQLAAWLNDTAPAIPLGPSGSPPRARMTPKELSSSKCRKTTKSQTLTRSHSKGRTAPSRTKDSEENTKRKHASPGQSSGLSRSVDTLAQGTAGRGVEAVDPFLKQFQTEQEEFDAWKAGIDRVLNGTAAVTKPRPPVQSESGAEGIKGRENLESVNRSAAAEEARRQLLTAIETARALDIDTDSELGDVDIDAPLPPGGSPDDDVAISARSTGTKSKPERTVWCSQKKAPRQPSAKDGCSSTCRLRMKGQLKSIKALQMALREKENTIKTLNLAVESKQKRILTLESMLPGSARAGGAVDAGKGTKDMDALRRAVQGLRKTEGEHTRYIKELEEEVRLLKRKDTRSQEVNAGIISKLKEQEKMLQEAVHTNTGLEATISQLLRRVEGKKKKCSSLEEEIEKLATQLNSTRVELNMKVRQYEALRKTVDRSNETGATPVDEILDGMTERAKGLGVKKQTTSKREAWMESSSSDGDEISLEDHKACTANGGIEGPTSTVAQLSKVLSEFGSPRASTDTEEPDAIALADLPPIPPAPHSSAPVPHPAPIRASAPGLESALTPSEFDELIKVDDPDDSQDFVVHESIMSKYEKLRSRYAKLTKIV